jgi:hypothetical protein
VLNSYDIFLNIGLMRSTDISVDAIFLEDVFERVARLICPFALELTALVNHVVEPPSPVHVQTTVVPESTMMAAGSNCSP